LEEAQTLFCRRRGLVKRRREKAAPGLAAGRSERRRGEEEEVFDADAAVTFDGAFPLPQLALAAISFSSSPSLQAARSFSL